LVLPTSTKEIGGILVRINRDTIQVNNMVNGEFCVKFHILSKRDGFNWALLPIYGAAQEAKNPAFFAELVRTCDGENLSLLIGGDFNIIRRK
jgi:hypothetical protein